LIIELEEDEETTIKKLVVGMKKRHNQKIFGKF